MIDVHDDTIEEFSVATASNVSLSTGSRSEALRRRLDVQGSLIEWNFEDDMTTQEEVLEMLMRRMRWTAMRNGGVMR